MYEITIPRSWYFNNKVQSYSLSLIISYLLIVVPIEVEQVIPLPSHQEVTTYAALPSVSHPSDHIALICDLRWNPWPQWPQTSRHLKDETFVLGFFFTTALYFTVNLTWTCSSYYYYLPKKAKKDMIYSIFQTDQVPYIWTTGWTCIIV